MTLLQHSCLLEDVPGVAALGSAVRQEDRGKSIGFTRRLSDLGTRFVTYYLIPTPPTFASKAQRAPKDTITPNFKYNIG
jgi:hypothetical protein